MRAPTRPATPRAARAAALCLGSLCAAAVANAAEPAACTPPAATLTSVQGSVEVRRVGRTDWVPGAYRDTLCAGDVVRVGERGRAAVVLRNDIELRLDERTSLTLAKVDAADGSLLEMCAGKLHFISRARKALRVVTPFVNASVEGTEVAIDHGVAEDRIDVFEGHVVATSEAARTMPQTCSAPTPTGAGGELLLASHESALVPAGSAPVRRSTPIVRPAEAVEWALYYPPLVDPGTAALAASTPLEARAARSVAQFRDGRLDAALAAIAPSADDAGVRDARFFAYRASLLLWVGRVDEARRDIERALAIDASSADALALQAIVAVVQNRSGEALELAQRAAGVDERSAAARIALSYALQAQRRIAEALAAAQDAARVAPDSPLAWSRVAELEMSLGHDREALAAAERARAAGPSVGRALTVLGFVRLARFETDAAKEAFEAAIAADNADPLPRLGLGLAKIRANDLAGGRADLEIAVGLDPASSILRSYVGKAYYEENRDALAASQFELAKERDPRDPTPWFYQAILEQTQNRPVEALDALERSIERNDNRAPYRSSLLLDEDRAARDVSLAWIYDDLGLDQLARTEATKAIAADPASSAGHQFLADAFGREQRQEITRVSELLQSQLLQPAIVAPLAPEATFRSLSFLSGGSPFRASYGEYSALFDRDRPNAQLGLVGGNLDTLSDVAAASARSGPWSFGAGQFYYHTDGYRPNNDITHRIYNAMAQLTATPGVDVQVEFRHRGSETGDVGANGPPDAFNPSLRDRVTHDIERVGVHATQSPESNWLFSYVHARRTEELSSAILDLGDVHSQATDDGDQAEAMYVYRSERVSVVTGAGWYGFDTRQTDVFSFAPCPPSGCETDRTARRANAYAYGTLRLPYRTQLLIGLSYDDLKDANLQLHKTSPKVGILSEPIDGLTLRAAAFRSVKPALIANQTLEPTQLFGFSQYADDSNGTVSDRYALAVDARLSNRVYAGAEATSRRLQYAFNTLDQPQFLEPRERTADGYLAWLPAPWLALSARVDWQQWKLDSDVTSLLGLPSRITSTDVPLAARAFRGPWSLSVITHLVEQRSDITVADVASSERSRFSVTDVAVSYRLPNRLGEVSLAASNVFDRSFSWREPNFLAVEPQTPRFVPARAVLGRLSLYF